MGEGIVNWYRNKVKRESKIAFYSALLIGLLTYLYKFVNNLPSGDSLFNTYASQNMIGHGRWFLAVPCAVSSFFDLPWVTGLFSLIYIAVAAVFIIKLFEVTNPFLITLISGFLVTSPAVVETLYYSFTADGYMAAMMMVTIAVYLLRFDNRKIIDKIVAVVLICLACGIYQVYLSFGLVLTLCYFMYHLSIDSHKTKEYLVWVAQQFVVFAVGTGLYMAVWKIILAISHSSATEYAGADSLSLGNFIEAISSSIQNSVIFFLQWNVAIDGFTVYNVLNLLFLLAGAVILVAVLLKSGLTRRYVHLLLFLGSLVLIPISACIFQFVTGVSQYPARMLYSMTLIYILNAIFCEKWCKNAVKNVFATLLAVIIFNNFLTANMYWYKVEQSVEYSRYTAEEIAMRIHEFDDGTDIPIAFVGRASFQADSVFTDPSEYGQLGLMYYHVYDSLVENRSYAILFLEEELGFRMSYYSNHPEAELPKFYPNPNEPAYEPYDLHFRVLDYEESYRIGFTDEVRNMGVWPAQDSVGLVNGVIVVKFSEPV